MPHITSILGATLRDMLVADGWVVQFLHKNGHTYLTKGDKNVGFRVNAVIDVKYVKAIAHNKAGWTAERFEEIRFRVLSSPAA
jgi:hypothetical protein